MKLRNEDLHEEVERLAARKMDISPYKNIAEKHHVTVEYVRQLVSAAVKRKRTIVMIHVERSDAKIAKRSEDSCENSRSSP